VAEREKEYDHKCVEVVMKTFYKAMNERNDILLRELWLKDPDTLLAPGGEETFRG